MKPSDLEALRGSTYADIENALASKSSNDLLIALDDSSSRVGDTAAEILVSRKDFDAIRQAVLADSLRSANGRIRASHVLKRQGSSCKSNISVYEHLLNDRSDGVVSNALFGLVFFPSPGSLALMQSIANDLPDGHRKNLFHKAIAAIMKKDSSLYSQGFTDVAGIWKAPTSKQTGF